METLLSIRRVNSVSSSALKAVSANPKAELEKTIAAGKKADGILFVLTKFCDPEEYDYVPVKRMTDAAGIPMLQIEIDQQMTNFAQAESAVQAFTEMLKESY